MSTKRKPLRARSSMPEYAIPTERQIEEAMIAFERAKVRYQLTSYGANQGPSTFVVHVAPEQFSADAPIAARYEKFITEADARRWREREIIREAITAGMRAKP